jgi:subtilisin-like proprotein convertase family protein
MRRTILLLATISLALLVAGGGLASATVDDFKKTQKILIRDNDAATPYPSEINVRGLRGSVTDVDVRLRRFTHSHPSDIFVMLEGPGGQNVVVMGRAGNGFAVSRIRLVFDDEAATPLPENEPLSAGTYQPTNYSVTHFCPAPAPAGSGATALSTFDGTDPNGTWKLWVCDTEIDDEGRLGRGWGLRIETG